MYLRYPLKRCCITVSILGSLVNMSEPEESISEDIQNKQLPWGKSFRMSFDAFNERYSLHDSIWISILKSNEVELSSVLAFCWDPVWLPKPVQNQLSNRTLAPYLFIRLKTASEIEYKGLKKEDLPNREISKLEHTEIEDKSLLVIEDIFGGIVYITFEGEPEFLALDQDWKNLSL